MFRNGANNKHQKKVVKDDKGLVRFLKVKTEINYQLGRNSKFITNYSSFTKRLYLAPVDSLTQSDSDSEFPRNDFNKSNLLV